jgi:serpin B
MRHLRLACAAALALGTSACDPPATPDTPASSQPSAPTAAGAAPSASASPAVSAKVSAPPSPDATKKLARGSNAFGLELFGKLRGAKGNVVFSPASVSTALAMTWLGAKDGTADEMKRVMHFDGTSDEVADAAGRLTASLTAPGSGVTCNLANRLFGEKSYAFERPFLDKTASAFGAPLEPVDFKGAPDPSRVHINDWVAAETAKRIENLIPEKAVTSDMRLVLVNAIYFLGDWRDPFQKGLTQDEPFFVTATEKKTVPLMKRVGEYRTTDTGDADVVELAYQGEKTAMLLVVPKQVDGLAAVEKSMDGSALARIESGLEDERILLRVPRFQVAPPTSLPLGKMLQELGMHSAFDPDLADFTAIANPPARADRLFIGEVFHKAFVKVDEKGTEAAAATAVMMPRGGGPPPSTPREVRADRPFLFFIRDRESGLVLFMGRVADPS